MLLLDLIQIIFLVMLFVNYL